VIFPKVLKHTESYIIESYEGGLKFPEFIKKYPDYAEEATNIIFSCYYVMFFSNFIHGDFHQSNFLLRLKDNRVQIIILDYGIMTKLTDEKVFNKFIMLFQKNMFLPDLRKLISIFDQVNVNQDADLETFKTNSLTFLKDIKYEELLKKIMRGEWKSEDNTYEFGKLMRKILDYAYSAKLKFPGPVLNICNGFMMIDEYRHQVSGNTSTWKNKKKYSEDNGFYDYCQNKITTTA
jgi:predicted unusual protein kinase regulating ubiquinone biosynthesis (AarF/ABC1/UbiB family)